MSEELLLQKENEIERTEYKVDWYDAKETIDEIGKAKWWKKEMKIENPKEKTSPVLYYKIYNK